MYFWGMKRKKHTNVHGTGGGAGQANFYHAPPNKNKRLRPIGQTPGNNGCLALLVFLFCTLAIACNAQGVFNPRTLQVEQPRQKYNWKHAIAPASLAFVSGAAWGLNQTLEHHNDRFFKVFPNASKRFWGPESWKNKYSDFDPANGRNRVPIWFTDGKHLTATIAQTTIFGAGVTIGIGQKRKWWHYVADAGISFAAYSAGNFLTYNLIFR